MKRFSGEFANYGGSLQLELRSNADLELLLTLDDPYWMALSAPVRQLRCPAPFIVELMDADGDGRIVSSDVRRVIAWYFRVLKDPTERNGKKRTVLLPLPVPTRRRSSTTSWRKRTKRKRAN